MNENLIPINIISGFLGSGKTTLLTEVLKNKSLKNTAVIINEFGEVSLDHLLVRHTRENIIELQNGCICCSIQNDLRNTLLELFYKTTSRNSKTVDRIIIETTGLADPLPISNTLLNCNELQKIYRLENLITVVDGINGLHTLKNQKEAIRQVFLASVIVLSKIDLLKNDDKKKLTDSIKAINSKSDLIMSSHGKVPLPVLFSPKKININKVSWDLNNLLKETINSHDYNSDDLNRHDNKIYSFTMTRDSPINEKSFDFFIKTLEKEMGPYLLRVKGIINISGINRPAIIHGSQKILHPVDWLNKWPSKDKRTRIIFITFNIKKTQFSGFCESILGLKEVS
jgi:G3E family GTPase